MAEQLLDNKIGLSAIIKMWVFATIQEDKAEQEDKELCGHLILVWGIKKSKVFVLSHCECREKWKEEVDCKKFQIFNIAFTL